MPEPMPQAFADAVCNVRADLLHQLELADESDKEIRSRQRYHSETRPRGREGTNGVACAECSSRAALIWADYQRILNRNGTSPQAGDTAR